MMARKYLQVVLFGDSVSWSGGAAYGSRYADFLEEALQSAAGKDALIDVAACGDGGNTAQEGLARIERDCIDYAPDIVVINFGGNDAIRSPSREIFKTSYERILSRLKNETHAVVVLETLPTLDEERHQCRQIPQALMHGGLEKYIEFYSHSFIRNTAVLRGCILHDRFRIYHQEISKNPAQREVLIQADGVHFTVEGNKFFAETLAAVIIPVLPRAFPAVEKSPGFWYERATVNPAYMEACAALENGRLKEFFFEPKSYSSRLALQRTRSFARRASVADSNEIAQKATLVERLAAGFLAAERIFSAPVPEIIKGSAEWALRMLEEVNHQTIARKLSEFLNNCAQLPDRR